MNSYVDPKDKEWSNCELQMYPEIDAPTTSKKRTKTQAQWRKADKHDFASKDKIFTNLKILEKESSITLIDGTSFNTEMLLPTDHHPFDHAVVTVKLERPS